MINKKKDFALLEKMQTRRSVKAMLLKGPGPNDEELQQILTIAMRVPDHGKLAPWRIKLLDHAAQAALREQVAARFKHLNPQATDEQIAFEAGKMQRAPLLLVVVYVPQLGRIPEWEQQLSCGAVCMNLLQACHALGYGANWLTEWVAFDGEISKVLGCGPQDRIAGFIYIGSYDEVPEDRSRPQIADVVTRWQS